jgi:hypothetical protein
VTQPKAHHAQILPTRSSRESILEGIDSEEFYHSGRVIDTRGAVSLLPIDDRHLVTANHFGGVDLPKSEVEPALADHFPNGLRIGRMPDIKPYFGAKLEVGQGGTITTLNKPGLSYDC